MQLSAHCKGNMPITNDLCPMADATSRGTKVALTLATTIAYRRRHREVRPAICTQHGRLCDAKLVKKRGRTRVLRISMEQDPGTLSLILEGRLVGPWVDELRRISAIHITRNVPLTIDLEGVTSMDVRGQALLDELRRDGARLRCSDVMNRYLVEQMARPAGKAQETCRPCRRFTSQTDSSAAAEDAFRSSQAS